MSIGSATVASDLRSLATNLERSRMSRDYGEIEREFLNSLKPDTGKDLAEWMQIISAMDFKDKGEAIDWLRMQGFLFAKASWLERIHNNGGRPIYAVKPATVSEQDARPLATAPQSEIQPAKLTPAAALVETTLVSDDSRNGAPIAALAAEAKGYRPLFHLLIASLERALPGLTPAAGAGYVSIGRPREFAAIVPGARGLRIALDIGDLAHHDMLHKSRIKGIPARLSHTMVLTDARHVNEALIGLFVLADRRVNG
jgi:hypothetical protein